MPTDSDELTYDPELAPGYFVQTRSDFLRFPGWAPPFKLLYQILCSYAAEGVKAWPGQTRLAHETALTEMTVRKYLKELEGAGLLTVRRRGQGLTNLYHLHKLATLPPNPERKKLSFRADRKKLSVKSANILPSRPPITSDKVESVETHSVEIEGELSPSLAEYNRRYIETHRQS